MSTELGDLRPRDAHQEAWSVELALSETTGATVVMGDAPPCLLLALGASSSGITLVGRRRRTREGCRLLRTRSPAWTLEAPADGEGLPTLEELHQRALIWDLPAKDPVAALERVLFAVADGGEVHLSVPRRGGSDRRVERIFESLCGGVVRVPSQAPKDRLVLEGVRRAPYVGDSEEQVSEPLPVSVIVATHGNLTALEDLLCDLLLRQRFPAWEVFVLDMERDHRVPETLFGFPSQSPSRVVLVRAGELSLGAAVNDALGGVTGTFTALFLEDGIRLAPNALVNLGMALEARSELSAVVCDWARRTGPGAPRQWRALRDTVPERFLRTLLDAPPPPISAALFRTQALRGLEGLDPEAVGAEGPELWFRLAAAGSVGVCPSVLMGFERPTCEGWPEGPPATLVFRRVREVSLARLSREFSDGPKSREAVRALTARASLAAEMGLWDAAHEDLEEALSLAADHVPTLALCAVILRAQSRFEEAERAARELLEVDPESRAGALELAASLGLRGRTADALSILDDLSARCPDLEITHGHRVTLLLAQAGVPEREAVRAWCALRRAQDETELRLHWL